MCLVKFLLRSQCLNLCLFAVEQTNHFRQVDISHDLKLPGFTFEILESLALCLLVLNQLGLFNPLLFHCILHLLYYLFLSNYVIL
jgi:hypothetical protein